MLLVAGKVDPDGLRKAMIEAGLNPLTIPAEIRPVEQVPKLGSGKSDFYGAKQLVPAA